MYAQPKMQDLSVIQNKTGFTKGRTKDVREVFLGKYSSWPVTREQTIIVLPSSKSASAASVSFVIYNGGVKQMQKYWLSLVFQGRANPPVFLDSDEEIVQYVLKTPGAIGLVLKNSKLIIEEKYQFLLAD